MGQGVYLQYGTYRHPVGEVGVPTIQHASKLTDGDLLYGATETWNIRGTLQADTQAALVAAMAALRAAYATNYRDIGLYYEDGTSTGLQMPGLNELGGVKVLEGVSFEADGAALSTFINYSIKVVGDFGVDPGSGGQGQPGNVPGFDGGVISFSETLQFIGGGPTFVMRTALVGPPIRQPTAQATPYHAIQSGHAVSLLGEPTPPGPLWPQHEHRERRRESPSSPERAGDANILYRNFRKEWSYEFESATPLIGRPNYWLLGG